MFSTAVEAVKSFITIKMNDPDSRGAFTADQLRFYVNNNVVGGISPSSADRALRNLRQNNVLDYVVLNRNKSLYRAMPVGTTTPATPKVPVING